MEQMKNLEIIGWEETVGEISGGKMDTSECKERVNQSVVWTALLCKELLVRRVQEATSQEVCGMCGLLYDMSYPLNAGLWTQP